MAAATLVVPAFVLLAVLGPAPVRAQSLPLEQVAPPAGTVLEIHARYDALMRQYRGLRPLPPDSSGARPPGGMDIDGLVIDETQTRIGRSFYDAFYQQWRAPDDASGFTISVQERPLRGQGVVVSVRVNDELAFQSRLQPRSEFDTIARQAVAYAYRRLKETGPQVIL